MVEASKLSNQALGVPGELVQTCITWRCSDGSQHLSCWSIMAVPGITDGKYVQFDLGYSRFNCEDALFSAEEKADERKSHRTTVPVSVNCLHKVHTPVFETPRALQKVAWDYPASNLPTIHHLMVSSRPGVSNSRAACGPLRTFLRPG
ncbi:hypothetical protein TNCV_1626911 [Trichonephila clavipes]|nr:hypothetical protein TNCV_1626911 [Trichonephila clavipes]